MDFQAATQTPAVRDGGLEEIIRVNMNIDKASEIKPSRDFEYLLSYLEDSYRSGFMKSSGHSESLFHYTDLNGLKGIITEHDLWLTDALYSNDDAEIKFGVKIAQNQIQSMLNTDPNKDNLLNDYLKTLAKLLEQPREGVYICCFCEEDDILSQWRAYGGNGNGVSIQLDLSEFDRYTANQKFGVLSIWKVVYEERKQQDTIKRAISNTFRDFQTTLPPIEIAQKAKDIIDFFIPTFKDRGFREEKEWRMILVPSPSRNIKPLYRVSHDMLIPYYSFRDLVLITAQSQTELKVWKLPIRKVLIGPGRHKVLN
jgi:hypothetical protein